MTLHRFLVLLITTVFILLVMLAWFLPSNDDFRTENPFWNGTRDMSLNYTTSPLESLSTLPHVPQEATLILIPYLDFTIGELEELNSFITRGGTLILADDYGYGNQILEYLGLKARFSNQILLDPLDNYKNNWFPRIAYFKPNPLTNNLESLVFNHATSLTNIATGEIMAMSSLFSFLDLNSNQIHDEDEPIGRLPVFSRHNLGDGQVMLISDPSIFINSMEAQGSNHNVIQNIAAFTNSNLLIDQSHLPLSNLQQTKNLLVRIRSFLVTLPGTLGLVILALTITLMPIWHKQDNKLS